MNNEKQFIDFRKEVERLKEIDGAEEYAKQLAHLFLGNGLSLQTILLMAIDFGQQHPHWIPVEEELPKERGQYFVYTAAGQSWQSEWMQDKSGEWYWFCSPMTVGTIANVTHWMPIVPPRKEVSNDILCGGVVPGDDCNGNHLREGTPGRTQRTAQAD